MSCYEHMEKWKNAGLHKSCQFLWNCTKRIIRVQNLLENHPETSLCSSTVLRLFYPHILQQKKRIQLFDTPNQK